jgi:hypothetical protein
MKYAIEIIPGGTICIPSFMTVCSGIHVMLRLIPQEFEGLHYWYYWRKRFIKAAVEMASNGIVYTSSLIMFGSELSRMSIHTDTHTHTHTHSKAISLAYFYFLKIRKID